MVSGLKLASKNSNKNENITIDAKHSEMINHFKDLKGSIPELKNNLKNLIKEYNTKDNSKKDEIEYIIGKDNLKDQINELKNKIYKIMNNDELNRYYLDVGVLLHNYYENIETSKNLKSTSEKFEENLINYNDNSEDLDDDDEEEKEEKESKNNYKSVLNFFNDRATENESDINFDSGVIEQSDNDGVYTSLKISDFVKEESTFKKKNILDEYLQKIDPNYVSKIKIDMSIFKCPKCNIDMTLFPSDGIQVCDKCGLQQNVLIESDKPSFKDPPLEVCYFSYKRINHYNEWLAQFQAKESTEIPNEVYEKILLEIKKERITNLEKLDTKKIRQYLKKIKLNKYYDHAAHILYQINGVQPPSMSKELEEKLRLMFKEIQGPFMQVCPKTRKNFLNYSYVLHKFVELLGLDDYKVYFPLLKDREKLHQTDMIWKKICEILGWDFIKSI